MGCRESLCDYGCVFGGVRIGALAPRSLFFFREGDDRVADFRRQGGCCQCRCLACYVKNLISSKLHTRPDTTQCSSAAYICAAELSLEVYFDGGESRWSRLPVELVHGALVGLTF